MRAVIGGILCFVTGFVLMVLFEAIRSLARARDANWIELEEGAEKLGQALGVNPDWIIAITGLLGFGIPIIIMFLIAGPNARRVLWLLVGAGVVWLPSLLMAVFNF